MTSALDLAAALENTGDDVLSVAERRFLTDAAALIRVQHEALTWIDEQYENVNLDHRHFRVGAKCKASAALEYEFQKDHSEHDTATARDESGSAQ